MKVNLCYGNGTAINGYLTIDPFGFNTPGKICGDIACLDSHVDDGECEELLALNVIDFIPVDRLQTTLEHWMKKVRHGGSIVIGGFDFGELCRLVHTGILDYAQALNMLYGGRTNPADAKASMSRAEDIIRLLVAHGFQIQKKRMNQCRYTISAKRK